MSDGEHLNIQVLVAPMICEPLSSQPITECKKYGNLTDLELADTASALDHLEVDLLLGSDLYWNLVTGKVWRGRSIQE